MKRIKFENINQSDLYLNAVYEGGSTGNLKSEVISKLLLVSNSGGFRKSLTKDKVKLSHVVLFDTGKDGDWKNRYIDNGEKYIYYGDNNKPGNDYLNTKKKGNKFLEEIFLLSQNNSRQMIPPIFLVESVKNEGRTVRFKGLLVPHIGQVNSQSPLELHEFMTAEGTYQNYIAIFDILNIEVISREWILDLKAGKLDSKYTPREWKQWVSNKNDSNLFSEESLDNYNENNIIEANTIDRDKISVEDLYNDYSKIITKEISIIHYNRSQKVISYVLDRANGYCEICNKPAPFIRKSDNSPYLEVHHIVPLSEGGDDSIDNTIAVCPNCHRHAHFG